LRSSRQAIGGHKSSKIAFSPFYATEPGLVAPHASNYPIG
jgi:hypothetical protein